jgi:hypothetical protein
MPVAELLPEEKTNNEIEGAKPPIPAQLSPVTPNKVPSLVAPEPTKQFSDQSVVNSLIKPADVDPFDKQNQEAIKGLVNWSKNPNNENNIKVADIIQKKNEQDQTGHINTQTQWGGVLMSLLNHDYKGVFKYFNGGPTRMEEAFSPVHGYAVKEFNMNGFTGRYFKKDEQGKLAPLDPKLINDIEKKGGYFISQSDLTAAADSRYKSASELAQKAMTGAPAIVMKQYETAAQTAQQASAYANAIQNRQNIVFRKDAKDNKVNAGWLDAIGHLKPEQLADLYRSSIEYKTVSANASSGAKANNNANVQLTDTESNKIGGNLGGGFGANQFAPEGGIAPSLNAGINGAINNSATNGVSVGGSSSAEAARSAGTTNQIQQQFINKVQSIVGGQIKTPQQFEDLQNYLALTNEINTQAAGLNLESKAPGTVAVSKVYDPLLAGSKNISIQDEQGKKNASLLSAWESFLAKKINETNGQPGSRDQLEEEFRNTNTFKGINYLYDNRIKTVVTGVKHQPQEGDIMVNPNTNRPEIYRNGRLEPLNVR